METITVVSGGVTTLGLVVSNCSDALVRVFSASSASALYRGGITCNATMATAVEPATTVPISVLRCHRIERASVGPRESVSSATIILLHLGAGGRGLGCGAKDWRKL